MPAENNPSRAALWMVCAIASFTLMAVAGRTVMAEMNSFELMAWRSAIGVAIVCALLSRNGFAQIRTGVPRLHILRNLFHFAAQNLWFIALGLIPLAQVVALEFTNPIWVALLAPLLLGETFTLRKAVAVAIGFVGVLVVVRPDAPDVGWGYAAGLVAGLGFAFNTIFTRRLLAHDGVLCVLFWMTLSQTVMGCLLGAPGGIPIPSARLLPWLVVLGVTGLSAHYALTSALRHAPATIVAPMDFLRLPVVAVVGALYFGEPLQLGVALGGALILGANLVNLSRPRGKTAAPAHHLSKSSPFTPEDG